MIKPGAGFSSNASVPAMQIQSQLTENDYAKFRVYYMFRIRKIWAVFVLVGLVLAWEIFPRKDVNLIRRKRSQRLPTAMPRNMRVECKYAIYHVMSRQDRRSLPRPTFGARLCRRPAAATRYCSCRGRIEPVFGWQCRCGWSPDSPIQLVPLPFPSFGSHTNLPRSRITSPVIRPRRAEVHESGTGALGLPGERSDCGLLRLVGSVLIRPPRVFQPRFEASTGPRTNAGP